MAMSDLPPLFEEERGTKGVSTQREQLTSRSLEDDYKDLSPKGRSKPHVEKGPPSMDLGVKKLKVCFIYY
jgi:hypothetical protein